MISLDSQIEGAGLDEKEMKILKEELGHHQLKLDQYYAFVDNLHETRDKTPEMENTLGHFLEDEDVVRSDKKGKSKDKTAPPKVKRDQIENASQLIAFALFIMVFYLFKDLGRLVSWDVRTLQEF